MASDQQQQQQQQQQPTHRTQTQQPSHQLPQTNPSPLSHQQQQQQQLSQSQQSQSQQGSLQQQAQSHQRQQPAAPQHQTSAANSLPQQTELLSHSNTTLDSGRHSGGGVGGSSNATGDPATHNLSSSDPHQTQQQFCLRWNNFQSNIVNSFETLLDREELVDVTLTAEGRSLRAHRVLLSACSPYFRDLFQDVPPHQHPVIVLRDTRFLELKCLLCFIYHGEVNVSQDNLSCLLNLAENLKVKGLAQEGTKRQNSKEYEYGGRGVLSPDREGDLSDGGEPSNIPRPSRGGHLLRPGRSVSPAPPGVSVPFGNLSALGSLLGNPGEGISRSQLDDHVRNRDIRDSHHNNSSSKGSSISLLNASQFPQHERKDQLHVLHQQQHHHQQQQQQHHSPPSKRRKRHPSPLQHHSDSNTTSSHHHQQQQQQQSERFTNNNSGSQLTPPSLPLSTSHNNGGGGGSNPTAHSNSSAHTPSAAADDDGNTHAVNLSVCPSTSPSRLMVPKLELITADDDTSNGEKERLERLEQRERICNFLDKNSIAGMISKFPGGFADSDMEGEEEPPPPHDEENSADMDDHGPGGGLSHPLSHHLPPGLQQSFVPYPPTTHAAAAAAAAAAHHHFANTFTPGPSGVPSSVSPASWRSHASDQNPNSPQGDEWPCTDVEVLKHELEDNVCKESPSSPQRAPTACAGPASDPGAGPSNSQLAVNADFSNETFVEVTMEEHVGDASLEVPAEDPLTSFQFQANQPNCNEMDKAKRSFSKTFLTRAGEDKHKETFKQIAKEFKDWQTSEDGALLKDSTANRHMVCVLNLARRNGYNIVDFFDEKKVMEYLTKIVESYQMSASSYLYGMSWLAKFIMTSHFRHGQAMISETEQTVFGIRESANAFISRFGRMKQSITDIGKAQANTQGITLALYMTDEEMNMYKSGTDYTTIMELKKKFIVEEMPTNAISASDFKTARNFVMLNICLNNPTTVGAVHMLTVEDFTEATWNNEEYQLNATRYDTSGTRTVVLTSYLHELLKFYIECIRVRVLKDIQNRPFIFTTIKGIELTIGGFVSALQNCRKRNIESSTSWHKVPQAQPQLTSTHLKQIKKFSSFK